MVGVLKPMAYKTTLEVNRWIYKAQQKKTNTQNFQKGLQFTGISIIAMFLIKSFSENGICIINTHAHFIVGVCIVGEVFYGLGFVFLFQKVKTKTNKTKYVTFFFYSNFEFVKQEILCSF